MYALRTHSIFHMIDYDELYFFMKYDATSTAKQNIKQKTNNPIECIDVPVPVLVQYTLYMFYI